MYHRRVIFLCGMLALVMSAWAGTQPGYTLHFNFLHSPAAARQSIQLAAAAGARLVSLVPPAHIWEDHNSLASLEVALAEAKRCHISIIFSRMDACQTNGMNWLFNYALVKPGQLPNGIASVDWFCATVGNHPFERWQREETAFYAQRFGHSPQLKAAAIGGLVEPFVSQRGSLLQWSEATQCYEIAQYTPEGLEEWHHWLQRRYQQVADLNTAYGTNFTAVTAVPLPIDNTDERFGKARAAYFDWVACLNDWVMTQYRENRRIWHQYARAPFLLQLSGFAMDKIARGQPEFAAFDIPAWLQETDATGLSLYTYSGYEDCGHNTDMATLHLVAGAREAGKSVIIMESGGETPEVTLDPHELSFVLRAGMQVKPAAQLYEYFRYQRDGRVDPGMMVDPDGKVHQPGYTQVGQLLSQLATMQPETASPCFYYLSVPLATRESAEAGYLNRTVYNLAGWVPCRLLPWASYQRVPTGMVVLVPPALAKVIPADQLHAFLAVAVSRGWTVVTDGETCKALAQLAPKVTTYPISCAELADASYVEEAAEALYQQLDGLSAFRQKADAQPVALRPGVYWQQVDDRLYLWVDDETPVRLHPQACRSLGITRVWGSTKSGHQLIASWIDEGGHTRTLALPCRQWRTIF